jgi:hypothetical protein
MKPVAGGFVRRKDEFLTPARPPGMEAHNRMNTYFLLIDSGAGIAVTILCLLVLAGVSFASYTGESEHGDDGHGGEGGTGH